MTRFRTNRAIAALASAMLLALSMFGATNVTAAQPGWDIVVTKLPAAVSPGNDAGYRLVVQNNGNSNISQLFLTDSILVPPTYLAGERVNLCDTDPVLFCTFGALNAHTSFTFTVAYTTSTQAQTFDIQFQLNTTGDSFKDKGKNSHGDTFTKDVSTALNGSANFAGGFVQDENSTIGNGKSLGRRNIQSTEVLIDATSTSGIPATVEDGSTITFPCVACVGSQLGEWADVQVAEGATVGGLIKITITVFEKNVPNNLDLTKVVVFHTYKVLNNANPPVLVDTTDRIETTCEGTPDANCLTATELASGDLQIEVYVEHNGGFKPGTR